MKIFKFLLIGLLSTFLYIGCTESYIEGYNDSPNSPSEVLESNLLTAAEVAVFGNVTGEFARVTSTWMQSQAGISNQSLNEIATYQVYEGDNTNEWGSIYTDWMETSQDLIVQAGDDNPYYKGMGIILKAWSGAFATDIWGDVPYSDALQGAEVLNPSFDKQEAIYDSVQTQLSLAINHLSQSADKNVSVPGSDDLIFEGDVNKWIKMAWMLKARYANRVSKKDPVGSADNVLAFLNNADLEGISDNVYAKFGEKANSANQWYAFYLQRANYMAMGEFFVNRLLGNNDPRLAFYADTTSEGEYVGSPVDSREIIETASSIGQYLNRSEKSVAMVTYEECKFLEAEAYLRKSNFEDAAISYNEGVKASVLAVTGEEASLVFVDENASMEADDMDLETIISGKYDALFSQVEVWSDWRRTGYPVLTANPDPLARTGGIPYRFPTPIDERLYNTNAVVVSDVYVKPWFAIDGN